MASTEGGVSDKTQALLKCMYPCWLISLGQHGLDSKWNFRQETGVTEVHVPLLTAAGSNLF
jgi:hypothetical protein